MPSPLGIGLAGISAAAALTASAVRHAGWWLEWHARMGPGSGSRELAEPDLGACAASE